MWNEEEAAMPAMGQPAISGPDDTQEESIARPRVDFDYLSQDAFANLRSGNPTVVMQVLAQYSDNAKASNVLYDWILPRLPAGHDFAINLINTFGFSFTAMQFYAAENVRVIGLSVFAWLEQQNLFGEALKILFALTSAGLSLDTANLFVVHANFTPASQVLAIANVYLRGGMLHEALAIMNRQVLSPCLRDWHKDCSFGLPEDMEKRNLIVKELITAAIGAELDTGLTVFKTIFNAQNSVKNPIDLHPLVERLLCGSIDADCAVTALELTMHVPWRMLLRDQGPSVIRSLVVLMHGAAPLMATEMFREGIRLLTYPKPGKPQGGVLTSTISSSWTAEEVKINLAISLADCMEHLNGNLNGNLSVTMVRIQVGGLMLKEVACGDIQPPCLARVDTSMAAAKNRLETALSMLVPPIGIQQSSDEEVVLAPVGVARYMESLRRRVVAFGAGNHWDDEPLPPRDPRPPNPITAKRPVTMKVIRNWGLDNRGPLGMEALATEGPM